MTLLSPPFALGAAAQVLSGRLLRTSLGAVFLPGAGVSAVSGVLVGPANTMGELTLPSPTQVTVQPFRAVVQNTQDLTAGQYVVTNDAAVTLAVSAQHATQFRRSLVVVEVNDSQTAGVASSSTTDRVRLHILDGALAASSGAAALPAVPANSLALGEVLIPPTGQTVTLTPYNPRTVARGGILPVIDDASTITGHAGAPGAGPGSYRDHPTRGLQRWTGTEWAATNPWISYTPAWTTTGGAPSLGNGTLTGRYRRRGRSVDVRISLVIGSTTTGGTGDFRFSLPSAAAADVGEQDLSAKAYIAPHTADFVGFGYIAPGAATVAPNLPQQATINATAPARNSQGGAGEGIPHVVGGYPFSTGSNLMMWGEYEAAA